jgi:hypothetical protein
MKKCLVCNAENIDAATSCPWCGEASWGPVSAAESAASPKTEAEPKLSAPSGMRSKRR